LSSNGINVLNYTPSLTNLILPVLTDLFPNQPFFPQRAKTINIHNGDLYPNPNLPNPFNDEKITTVEKPSQLKAFLYPHLNNPTYIIASSIFNPIYFIRTKENNNSPYSFLPANGKAAKPGPYTPKSATFLEARHRERLTLLASRM